VSGAHTTTAARDLTTRHAGLRTVIVAASAAGAAAVAVSHRGQPVVAGLLSAVVLCYGALSWIDLAEQRLPNAITLPLAATSGSAVVIAAIARSDLGSALGALAVGLAFSVALAAMRFGMGDVKLAMSVGTIAGWLGGDAVMATAVAGSLAGAVAALVLIAAHRRRDVTFGFGPFLAIGSVAGMLVAGP
jgi:leader peptidase (prepilin peptidase)/N-methyltransferase